MENKLKKKSENSQFVTTVYRKEDDEVVYNYPFDTEVDAREAAEYIQQRDNEDWHKGYYVEVWEQDETGGYGNSGSPIYKSDDTDNQAIGKLFKESKVEDSTDAWKVLREYMLSRISMRFDTLEEMEDEVNEKFKSIMEQIQGHYDSWFESELKQNYSVYGIEILGKDEDVIVEDEEELDESQLGKLDEEQPEERGNVEDIDFEEQ